MAHHNDEKPGDGAQSDNHGNEGSGYGYHGGYGSYSSTAGTGGTDGKSGDESKDVHDRRQIESDEPEGHDRQPSAVGSTGTTAR